jgi:hypothetical protein
MIRRTIFFLIAFAAVAMSVGYCADDAKPDYLGSGNCQRCHFAPIQLDLDEGRTYFLGMDESKTWQTHDRHSKAFKLLQSERGQEMARRLGWNVTSDQRCLSCHADWQTDRSQPDDGTLAEGVACEACHGASSRYMNEHTAAKWRQLPLDVRANQFGMINVRDPESRAKVCLSCHIGNADQGKVLTHEMYAAGHPPLPCFELRHFGNSMRHWSDIGQQLAKLDADHPPNADRTRRDLEFIKSQLGDASDTLPGLKSTLLGGVLTLRESVQLLADESSGKTRRSDPSAEAASWPDFAALDCAMCHHDLHYPAWRQTRPEHSSGRPQIPRWPEALVGVAISQVAGSDRQEAIRMQHEFVGLISNLRATFVRQPFGDPVAILQSSAPLISFLDPITKQLKSTKFDRTAALLALNDLCASASDSTPDFATARQLAWAFQSIYDEVKPLPASAAIDKELEGLRAELRLALSPLASDAKDLQSQAISDSQLQAAMNLAAEYSPQAFSQHFRAIAAALRQQAIAKP